MRGQAQGTILQRLHGRNIHGWRARINSTDRRRPSITQERAVENLLLDAIDQVEVLQRQNKNLFEQLHLWKQKAEHLQRQLDAKTIGELVS